MKTSEIEIGTVYLIDSSPNWAEGLGYPRQGVVLGTGYSSRNYRFPSKTKGYGKQTGVLIVVPVWLSNSEDRAPIEDVLKLREEDVARPNAELPDGWTWGVVQPSAVRETWEDWLKRRDQLKAKRAEMEKQADLRRREQDEEYRLKQEARERVLKFIGVWETDKLPDEIAGKSTGTTLTLSDIKLALGVK